MEPDRRSPNPQPEINPTDPHALRDENFPAASSIPAPGTTVENPTQRLMTRAAETIIYPNVPAERLAQHEIEQEVRCRLIQMAITDRLKLDRIPSTQSLYKAAILNEILPIVRETVLDNVSGMEREGLSDAIEIAAQGLGQHWTPELAILATYSPTYVEEVGRKIAFCYCDPRDINDALDQISRLMANEFSQERAMVEYITLMLDLMRDYATNIGALHDPVVQALAEKCENPAAATALRDEDLRAAYRSHFGSREKYSAAGYAAIQPLLERVPVLLNQLSTYAERNELPQELGTYFKAAQLMLPKLTALLMDENSLSRRAFDLHINNILSSAFGA